MEKKPTIYLRNADLLVELKKSREQDKMTDNLIVMLTMLIDRVASSSNFANYTYIEEMKGCAQLNICKSWVKFNPQKSQNPFAYFTTCVRTAFIQYLKYEKNHQNIRDKMLVLAGENPSQSYQERDIIEAEFDRNESDSCVTIFDSEYEDNNGEDDV